MGKSVSRKKSKFMEEKFEKGKIYLEKYIIYSVKNKILYFWIKYVYDLVFIDQI